MRADAGNTVPARFKGDRVDHGARADADIRQHTEPLPEEALEQKAGLEGAGIGARAARFPDAEVEKREVGAEIDGIGAHRQQVRLETRTQGLDGGAAARQKDVSVVPLRDALAGRAHTLRFVPLNQGHRSRMRGRRNGGEDAGDAAAYDHGPTRAHLSRSHCTASPTHSPTRASPRMGCSGRPAAVTAAD